YTPSARHSPLLRNRRTASASCRAPNRDENRSGGHAALRSCSRRFRMDGHSTGAPLGTAADARRAMPRYQQFFQFVGVGLPFVGLPLAVWLLWGHGVSAADLAIMASLYVLTGLGIGVGYH